MIIPQHLTVILLLISSCLLIIPLLFFIVAMFFSKKKLSDKTMKILSSMITTALVIFVLIMSNITYLEYKQMHTVNAGDIWVKKTICKDPFKTPTIDTIKVLKVKDDYALYVVDKDTMSNLKTVITLNAKLLNPRK